MITYGEYISKKREEKGYSQRKLSLLSGVSNTTIWRMESGETKKPEIDSLKAIEKALGLQENTIVDIAYPPNSQSSLPDEDELSSEEKYPKSNDLIEYVIEEAEKHGYNLRDKSKEEIASIVVKALKIDEISKSN